MEKFLIEKLAAVTDEEKNILAGGGLKRDIYTADGDFVISSDKMTGGMRDITVRTHTRYTDFPLHKHNYLEIMIVLSGKITHHISGEELSLGEGDVLVLNKHVTHSIDRADTGDIGVNLILSDSFVESLFKELSETVFSELANHNSRHDGAGIYLAFSTKDNKQISNIIENLLFELTEYSADMHILRSTTTLLFSYLSRKSKKLLRAASRLPDKNALRRAEVLGYIRENYKNASLKELADRMFLSTPYLSKLIVEFFGKSFKELLLDERMNRALLLISKSDMPIEDIINSVGYENKSYFHREFRKKYGKTPMQHRKNAK